MMTINEPFLEKVNKEKAPGMGAGGGGVECGAPLASV